MIDGLKVGGDAGAVRHAEGRPAAPLGGMGISFSSSLFGLAGSLILGSTCSRASANRFYTELGLAGFHGTQPCRREGIQQNWPRSTGCGSRWKCRGTTAAMANLAEHQGLVTHMRTEQQMIRNGPTDRAAESRDQAALSDCKAA